MSHSNPPPTPNRTSKDDEDQRKLLEYINPLLIDFAKKNRITPAICYEVCCELEMSLLEQCKSEGIDSAEMEMHRHVGEMNYKARKEKETLGR
jgi:hypothetical protein